MAAVSALTTLQDVQPYRIPDQLLWTGRYLKDINIEFGTASNELIIYDEASIESMLTNIWFTLRGERPFEPTFGSNIPALLWEPCDRITAWHIESDIFDSTSTWMPYINIDYRNTWVKDYPDQNLYRAQIAYQHLVTGLKRGFSLNLMR